MSIVQGLIPMENISFVLIILKRAVQNFILWLSRVQIAGGLFLKQHGRHLMLILHEILEIPLRFFQIAEVFARFLKYLKQIIFPRK